MRRMPYCMLYRSAVSKHPKGKERKGKERKGKERKGKERVTMDGWMVFSGEERREEERRGEESRQREIDIYDRIHQLPWYLFS